MEQRLLDKNKKNKGFVTLFIVVILGSVALGLIFSLSQGSFMSIKASNENKKFSKLKLTVDTCAEIALEKIRENNDYIGSENVLIDGNICNFNISNEGLMKRVDVSSNIGDFNKGLIVIIDSFNPISIFSWQEV